MSRMMRKHAESLVGQSVYVYHVEGIVYHGVLHSVTHEGIYLASCTMMNQISAKSKSTDVHLAVADSKQPDVTQVFFPFFFVPFAFLTGVAAANIARPPYYYGYPGYYPPYGPGPYW